MERWSASADDALRPIESSAAFGGGSDWWDDGELPIHCCWTSKKCETGHDESIRAGFIFRLFPRRFVLSPMQQAVDYLYVGRWHSSCFERRSLKPKKDAWARINRTKRAADFRNSVRAFRNVVFGSGRRDIGTLRGNSLIRCAPALAPACCAADPWSFPSPSGTAPCVLTRSLELGLRQGERFRGNA